MANIKQLKGTLDLAILQHQSFQNEDTKAALDAAQAVYDASVLDGATDEIVGQVIPAVNAGNGGIVEAGIDEGKALPATPVKPAVVAKVPVVEPVHKPLIDTTGLDAQVTVLTSPGEGPNVSTGLSSEATQAAQEIAAEKKSE